MRYGFKTAPQQTTWPAMLDVWRAGDDIDIFESAWTFDHFYPIWPADPHDACFEGWTTLTALAQATSRLRVGVMVSGVVYRHPAVLANMAATVDIISGGRLELGLGAAWNQMECDAYGIELGSVTERFDRFEEACAVISSLLENETTTFDGTYYKLTAARCEPKPVQAELPICIGGGGEKRTLPLVARYADHWNFLADDVDMWSHKRDVLARCCADIGRDPAEIHMSIQAKFDRDDPAAFAEKAAALAEAGLDELIVYLPPDHGPADLELAAGTVR